MNARDVLFLLSELAAIRLRAEEAEKALGEEQMRHHALRWMLGLETHNGEEQQSPEDCVSNLLALLHGFSPENGRAVTAVSGDARQGGEAT